ncbi:hypothetical protein M0802_000470 [Mischocyttarus mexicanus]|nr:hypothetical protein M0802_000470 [Mischocyttarus mexicanus]
MPCEREKKMEDDCGGWESGDEELVERVGEEVERSTRRFFEAKGRKGLRAGWLVARRSEPARGRLPEVEEFSGGGLGRQAGGRRSGPS